MKKSLIIFILLVLGCAVIWAITHPGAHRPTQQASTPEASSPRPTDEVQSQSLDQSTAQYQIQATYPIVRSAGISSELKKFVDTSIAAFKDDIAWALDPKVAPAEAANLSFSLSYDSQKNAVAQNYIFTIQTYTGGAHGLEVTKVFSYTPQGKKIELTDLFSNGVTGLEAIAPIVKADLMNREFADADWITEGTAPTQDNYQNFIITPEVVTFIFDPYQVAPYAAGSQKVVVPLSAFKSIANSAVFK